jgi:hypothetical protein
MRHVICMCFAGVDDHGNIITQLSLPRHTMTLREESMRCSHGRCHPNSIAACCCRELH